MYIAGYVTDVAVDADGRYFVTAESDQRVLMWNLKVRKFQKQIFLFSFLLKSVHFKKTVAQSTFLSKFW